MKFSETPHPLVEDHFYIQDLINAQEKRSNDRTFHRERVKALEERDDVIKDNQGLVTTDFYCETCREDFKGQAVKQIEQDWSCSNQNIAFYKTKCFKGHWVIRHITDKHKDGYFVKSRIIARQRGVHHDSIVQPFETGYNLLYGKKNA